MLFVFLPPKAQVRKLSFDEMFDSNFIHIFQFGEELEKFHPELSERQDKIHDSLSKRDFRALLNKESGEKNVDVLRDCPKEDAEFLDKLQDMYVRWCQQKYIEYNLTKSGDMI